MTAVARVQQQTILAFDSLAARYDDLFTRSTIGRAQRGAVWEIMLDTFEDGSHILEVNCGTGEDALFLAGHNMSVVACDASPEMIQVARQRKQVEDPDAPIQFEQLATEHVAQLAGAELFDAALSNFSGMNCIANLSRAARDLGALLYPGAPMLICFSTRFCLVEMLWFLAHGEFRKAFRRTPGHATVRVGNFQVRVHYPTLGEVKRLFSPLFRLRSCTGIGILVPPSYLEPRLCRHPRLLELLRRVDRLICRLPLLRTLGDHMLLHFEREGNRCW